MRHSGRGSSNFGIDFAATGCAIDDIGDAMTSHARLGRSLMRAILSGTIQLDSSLDMKLAHGPVPLYHQLEQDLRMRIMAHEFAPGDLLPTVENVCERYGVSRITVRRAFEALLADGLIVRKRGVGSFVAECKNDLRSIQLAGSLDEFLSTAELLHSELLGFARCDPPPDLAVALEIEGTETAKRLELISTINGEPVGYLEIYFPQAVGELLCEEDLRESGIPVIRIVERKLGVNVMRAEQFIESDRAGAVAGPHLGLAANDPVLRVTRVYFLASGRPVEAVLVRYHPKRYRYTIDFVVPDGIA